jgi:hypothetical protein
MWASSVARGCDAMLGNASMGGGAGDRPTWHRFWKATRATPRVTKWGTIIAAICNFPTSLGNFVTSIGN